MIAPASNAQVLVATKPVDFRKGADGLSALVQESQSEPLAHGHALWRRGCSI
jgi:transposase